jgi:hypothetical protein
MPIIVTTREIFPKATMAEADVEWEKNFRILGGALDSSIKDDGTNWILVSEWDLIGQNDS